MTAPADDRYAEIWARAEPYWQTRSNQVHVPTSYRLARELLAAHPEVDADIVLPAILLHDIGYMAVPHEDHLKGLAGAVTGWDSDITRRHEVAGAELAGEILREVDWDPDRIPAIQAIVDGHDSRTEAISGEDELVKDADKLWRFTDEAVQICHVWMKRSESEFLDWLSVEIDRWFFTQAAREIAGRELGRSRAALAARTAAV